MKFKEAMYYKKLAGKKVHCQLCPHSCFIENGEAGKCEVRQNVNGSLKSMEYGKPFIIKNEKIEKFMFHVLPGERALGIGNLGNTLSVKIIENEIKREGIITTEKTPGQIIKDAQRSGNKTIVYGYTEPTTFYEYMKDIAEKESGLKHIIVSNGFINNDPLIDISKFINGASIKLKAVDNEIYDMLYGINIEPILKSILNLKEHGVWIEINIKLIKGMNDSLYELRKIASWILNNLGTNVPLVFIPSAKSDIETIKKARKSAIDSGLNYVYIKSDWIDGKTTFCPNCKKAAIIRDEKIENNLIEGKCKCGQEIPGIWA